MATIVVADDDAASRMLMTTLLEHAGHTVAAVANGTEALDLVRREPPDLVLTDLSMPGIAGVDLIRALRRDPQTRGVRVALYTATLPNAALRDFMNDYEVVSILSKPAEPETILSAIAEILKR
jgi:CheY-like chemotaxis protein